MKKRYKKYLESIIQNHLLIVEAASYYSEEGKNCDGLICLDVSYKLYCLGRYSLYQGKLNYYLHNKYICCVKLLKIFNFKLKEKYNTINTIIYCPS